MLPPSLFLSLCLSFSLSFSSPILPWREIEKRRREDALANSSSRCAHQRSNDEIKILITHSGGLSCRHSSASISYFFSSSNDREKGLQQVAINLYLIKLYVSNADNVVHDVCYHRKKTLKVIEYHASCQFCHFISIEIDLLWQYPNETYFDTKVRSIIST